MRVLVTGAKGMLGRALLPCLEGEHEVVGVDLQDFDISQEAAVEKAFRDLRPEFVFHLAAYTDVDGCEANPRMAREVNTGGTRNIAKSCAEIGAILLYVSTDYVFDGSGERPWREDDVPNPLSVYGRSKLGGEQHVQALLARHFIVRSSWLYGPQGKNFVATILKIARERDELRVVSEQRGSPTYTPHLALKLAQMLRVQSYGIYHVTGAGNCSWFEFAQAILKLGGFDRVRVVPISIQESGRLAPRPAFSVLENRRGGMSNLGALPHWREGLAQYLKEGQRLGEFVLPAPESREKSLTSGVTRL
ncbi:MAG: dTDP-4-dehydrorhamnose reductase [Terriglobia bacterium]